MSANLYEARNLVQRYNGREALSVQHLAIEEGEAVFLTGPNGCGKSTLLRLLAFLERPAAGELRYAGGAEGRKEATLLLQDPYLLHMSVFNNVVLGLKLRHQGADLRQTFECCMQAAGFDDPWNFADRGPRELSGGERQRVALASRLALRPRVLLLDEPTANVDAASARAIALAVRNSTAEGMTVVCATHDPALLRAIDAREIKLGTAWDMDARVSSL
ncbi:ABC transporter ATP-binding protein [Desulfovibrio desulfuricans]|jgi:ABC-type sugar transport systems, ATPase components|uniref:ABC transporter ATP-binding protein n=1 Tax=Desulfovibrio desulfuricans TaxID=876 RepID=UPI001C029247|nr:ABC transporter ATP-binding protein [Desulfovibrio desulfuricans]MBT9748425.1 ATP-binding cassette domain-containing protein [Desulfovibrio desulfuricans]